MTAGVVVFGIGNADRGDDGVGPAVARTLLERGVPGLRVVVAAEPLDLLDDDVSGDVVVVVDAACSGRPAGTVLVIDAQRQDVPLWAGAGSTHGVGLVAVVGLLTALDRVPQRLVLVAVEAATFDPGAALSPAVQAAVPVAADAVLTVAGLLPGGDR
jgi:hydrogenase maturation protease